MPQRSGTKLAQVPAQVLDQVLHHHPDEARRIEPNDVDERGYLPVSAVEELLPVPLPVHRVAHVDVVRVGERVPRVNRVHDEPGQGGRDETAAPDRRALDPRAGVAFHGPKREQEKKRARPEEEPVVPGGKGPSPQEPRSEQSPRVRPGPAQKQRDRAEDDREEEHVRPHLVGVGEEGLVGKKKEQRAERGRGPEETSVNAVREEAGENRAENRERLRRLERLDPEHRDERDRERITPPLRIVVRDVDLAVEQVARRGAVLPVEVRLDRVVANSMFGEDLGAPVAREDGEERVGDPARPSRGGAGSGRRAGARRGTGMTLVERRLLRAGAPGAAAFGRHQRVRPTASAIWRIWLESAANWSGKRD